LTATSTELAAQKGKVAELTGKLSAANSQLAKAADELKRAQADRTKLIEAVKANAKAGPTP
jgi:hypothetical protein